MPGRRLEHRSQAVMLQHLGEDRLTLAAQLGRLSVPRPRIRGDHHPRAGETRPPAEVEILAARRRRGIETAELGEQIRPHEHGRTRHVEHVADRVVLLLVDLARLDVGVRHRETVDREPDFEEHVGPVVVHELRPDDRGVRAVRLLNEEPRCVGIEHDVVMAQEQERRARHHLERVVGRDRKPDVALDPLHEGSGQHLGDPRGGVLGGAGIEDEHRERRIISGPERLEALLEPGSRVPCDHHRDNGWDSHRLRRLVDGVVEERRPVGGGHGAVHERVNPTGGHLVRPGKGPLVREMRR